MEKYRAKLAQYSKDKQNWDHEQEAEVKAARLAHQAKRRQISDDKKAALAEKKARKEALKVTKPVKELSPFLKDHKLSSQ